MATADLISNLRYLSIAFFIFLGMGDFLSLVWFFNSFSSIKKAAVSVLLVVYLFSFIFLLRGSVSVKVIVFAAVGLCASFYLIIDAFTQYKTIAWELVFFRLIAVFAFSLVLYMWSIGRFRAASK